MASEKVKILTEQTFDAAIKEGVTLVDFWADWCVPCKMMAPTVDKLAEEYEGKLQVAKVDIENAQDLAVRYDIMSIPTLILFRNGELVVKKVGVMPKKVFEQEINKLI